MGGVIRYQNKRMLRRYRGREAAVSTPEIPVRRVKPDHKEIHKAAVHVYGQTSASTLRMIGSNSDREKQGSELVQQIDARSKQGDDERRLYPATQKWARRNEGAASGEANSFCGNGGGWSFGTSRGRRLARASDLSGCRFVVFIHGIDGSERSDEIIEILREWPR